MKITVIYKNQQSKVEQIAYISEELLDYFKHKLIQMGGYFIKTIEPDNFTKKFCADKNSVSF